MTVPSRPLLLAALYLAAGPGPPDPGGWPPAYPVAVVRTIDGDTFEGDVQLGLGVTLRRTFRPVGLDAWEVRGPTRRRGLAATAALRRLLARGGVRARPVGTDPFGRVLAEVWAGPIDVAAAMYAGGHDSGGRWGRRPRAARAAER